MFQKFYFTSICFRLCISNLYLIIFRKTIIIDTHLYLKLLIFLLTESGYHPYQRNPRAPAPAPEPLPPRPYVLVIDGLVQPESSGNFNTYIQFKTNMELCLKLPAFSLIIEFFELVPNVCDSGKKFLNS